MNESRRIYIEKKRTYTFLSHLDSPVITSFDNTNSSQEQEATKQASLITHNGVEEGGLADVGKPYDAGAEAHAYPCRAAGREPPGAAGSTPAPGAGVPPTSRMVAECWSSAPRRLSLHIHGSSIGPHCHSGPTRQLHLSPPLWLGFRAGRVTALPTARLSPHSCDQRVTEQTAPRLSSLCSTESTLVHSSRPNRVMAPAIDGPHQLLWTDRRKTSGRW